MLTNYFTLRYLASKLHSTLPGLAATEVFSQERRELVVAFGRAPRLSLCISCRPDANTCYLQPSFARARRNSIDLLPGLMGETVQSVNVLPADRVIHIALSHGKVLAIEFFGVNANVLLVNAEGTIEDAFLNPRERRGTAYAAKEIPEVYDMALLKSVLGSEAGSTLGAALRKVLPSFGSTVIGEILSRASLDTGMPAAAIDETRFQSLLGSIQSVLQEIDDPRPRLYRDRSGAVVIFSLIRLRHAGSYSEELFDDVHSALRSFVTGRLRDRALEVDRSVLLTKLGQQMQRAQRSVAAAETDLRDSDRAVEYKRYGALLLAHASSDRGESSVTLPEDGVDVAIPLDPRFSRIQNAQRYFSRAKRARLAQEHARERLVRLREKIAAGKVIGPLLEQAGTQTELRTVMAMHGEELETLGLGPKRKQREEIPFRVFTVDGGFEVWAGKSSANNDLLTMKFARPNDLWFHARGSSGSHVVLRVGTGKGEPGKRAREQAAGIAAYYSRMKTAGTVPVAMTQRKYVRKPHGAPAGTVVIEREKVLFVEPALPRGNDPSRQ